jgi:hypothetical protein
MLGVTKGIYISYKVPVPGRVSAIAILCDFKGDGSQSHRFSATLVAASILPLTCNFS